MVKIFYDLICINHNHHINLRSILNYSYAPAAEAGLLSTFLTNPVHF